MLKKKLVGYMLGNENHVVARGDQWCEEGTKVYVCPTKDMAKAILEQSQRHSLAPHIVWTTIYRVWAEDIEIDYFQTDRLVWTRQGNKIIVDAPVFYRAQPVLSEQRLLHNAAQIKHDFAKLIRSSWVKEMRR